MSKYKVEHKNNTVLISRPGRCALCPSTWGMTKHHLFGRGHPIIMNICSNCHQEFNNEVNTRNIGTFTRHIVAILAEVWPVTAPMPEWTND